MSSECPRITIVTPSFNQASFLDSTIRSVLDQDYGNIQYGVVDGGSTDGSIDVIDRYRDRLDFAIVEPDRGQAEAINKGLRRADGDVVGWLCSDDTLRQGALQSIGGHFADHGDDAWLAGSCDMVEVDGRRLRPNRPTGDFTLAGALLRDEVRTFNLPQPGVFWRRSLHDRLGWLDESLHYCMDFEFWLRLLSAGYQPALLDVVLATYRLHGKSKTCTQRDGFLREHLVIERRYARHLAWLDRLRVWRRLGYTQRTLATRASRRRLWARVIQRPWWLGSQQVRQALWAEERRGDGATERRRVVDRSARCA